MHILQRIVICEQEDPSPLVPHILRMGHETVRGDYMRLGGAIARGWWHGVFQFTLSGHGWIKQGGQRWAVGPGQGFIGHLADESLSYGIPDGSREDWSFVFLSFDGEGVQHMIEGLVRRHGPVFSMPRDNDIARHILRITDNRPNLSSILTRTFESAALLMTMFDQVSLHQAKPEQHGNSRLLQQALDVICKRVNAPFNVKALARLTGYSREHITKVFKAHLDKTPHQVILETKIEEAKRQLLSTTLSVREVADILGMGSGQNFCRVFKRSTGVTPNRYREINSPVIRSAG